MTSRIAPTAYRRARGRPPRDRRLHSVPRIKRPCRSASPIPIVSRSILATSSEPASGRKRISRGALPPIEGPTPASLISPNPASVASRSVTTARPRFNSRSKADRVAARPVLKRLSTVARLCRSSFDGANAIRADRCRCTVSLRRPPDPFAMSRRDLSHTKAVLLRQQHAVIRSSEQPLYELFYFSVLTFADYRLNCGSNGHMYVFFWRKCLGWKLAYHANCWGPLGGNPVGVTSVTQLTYKTFGDMAVAARDIAAAGYEGIEFFDGNVLDEAVNGFQPTLKILADTKLKLVALYSGANFIYRDILDDELARIERAADAGATLGAEHLVVGGGARRNGGVREADYDALAKALDQVVRIAESRRLRAHYHPHLSTIVESPEQNSKHLRENEHRFLCGYCASHRGRRRCSCDSPRARIADLLRSSQRITTRSICVHTSRCRRLRQFCRDPGAQGDRIPRLGLHRARQLAKSPGGGAPKPRLCRSGREGVRRCDLTGSAGLTSPSGAGHGRRFNYRS